MFSERYQPCAFTVAWKNGLKRDERAGGQIAELTKRDVVTFVSIATIGILYPIQKVTLGIPVVIGRIDVVVFIEDVGGVDDYRCPELGLDNGPVFNGDVGGVGDGK